MASGTILFGFAAVFCCLEHLEEATTKIQAEQSGSAWLAAAAFVAAVVTTFGLTLLLLFSYIRALDAGRRFLFLGCLAKSTGSRPRRLSSPDLRGSFLFQGTLL
jgi:hypothetical protein